MDKDINRIKVVLAEKMRTSKWLQSNWIVLKAKDGDFFL